jgi:hypothetical protein
LEKFFYHHSEFFIQTTVVNSIFQHNKVAIDGGYFQTYVTVVYNQDCKLYTKDHILGEYRKWKQLRDLNWNPNRYSSRYDHGQRHCCYGKFRKIKTFQESKMWFDVDEYKIKGRAKRSKANLPDSWYDISTNPEKSWKYQTKNKHQYK